MTFIVKIDAFQLKKLEVVETAVIALLLKFKICKTEFSYAITEVSFAIVMSENHESGKTHFVLSVM